MYLIRGDLVHSFIRPIYRIRGDCDHLRSTRGRSDLCQDHRLSTGLLSTARLNKGAHGAPMNRQKRNRTEHKRTELVRDRRSLFTWAGGPAGGRTQRCRQAVERAAQRTCGSAEPRADTGVGCLCSCE